MRYPLQLTGKSLTPSAIFEREMPASDRILQAYPLGYISTRVFCQRQESCNSRKYKLTLPIEMNSIYYDTIDKLEKMGVERAYIQGWAGGFLGNPKLEEQRVTPAYEAGYEDGASSETTNAEQFI
jgi:hypothetical protein